MSENGLDLVGLMNQIKDFDVTEFEKSLTQEEADRFRVYIMNHHKMALKYERAIGIMRSWGLARFIE